jgi:hypothetical protein
MKAHTYKQVVEVAQGACMADLEADNAKLLAQLEQTHLALAEAGAARNSLSLSHRKLEECVGLCAAVDTLKQEKAQITTDHEADVAAEQIFFMIIVLVTARGFV